MDKARGRKDQPTRYESEFWDRFAELLMDDPEDKHNELIEILRNRVIEYFREHDKLIKYLEKVRKESIQRGKKRHGIA